MKQYSYLAALILTLSCVTAGAIGQPRNILGARDHRLSALVTLAHRRVAVPELLARMSEQSGAALRAEGVAADLHVTAFAEAPARDVMQRLALLLNLTWRTSGHPSKPEYVLNASADDTRTARALVERDRQAFRSEIKRLLLMVAEGRSPDGDDYLGRKVKSLSFLSATRPAAQMACQLPTPLFDACLNGQEVRLTWAQMSPPFRESFSRYLAGQATDRDKLRAEPGAPPAEPRAIFVPMQQAAASEQVFVCAISERFEGGRSASFRIGSASNYVTIPVRPAEQDEVPSNASRRHFLSREVAPSLEAGLVPPDPLEPWETTLEQFARTNHVSVLSDAYDASDCPAVRRFKRPLWPPEKGTPDRLLDQLCSVYDYQWNAAAPPYLFRRRDWYALRERQISDTQWARWRFNATRTGRFELTDLAEMASLANKGQREKLLRYAGQEAWREALRNREILAFFGLLPAKQRAALSQDGVTVANLSLAHKRVLAIACSRMAAPGSDRLPDPGRIRTLEGPEHASIFLEFRGGNGHEYRFESRPPKVLDPWALLGR